MTKYAVELIFDKDEDQRLAVRPAHRVYLEELTRQGKVVAAGPFGDDTGALIVYDVQDEMELKAILDVDPYFESDTVSIASQREWNQILP